MNPGLLFVILGLVFGGLFAGGMTNESLMLGFMGLDALYSIAMGITILVMAFMHGVGQGLLTLCLPFYVIYFAFVVNENGYIKALFGWNLINFVLWLLMLPRMESAFPGTV